MTGDWSVQWVRKKSLVALALQKGEAGAGYSEAVMVGCGIISALSSDLWPGKRIDKARFIELLVLMTEAKTSAQTISIPLLVQHLEGIKIIEKMHIPYQASIFQISPLVLLQEMLTSLKVKCY